MANEFAARGCARDNDHIAGRDGLDAAWPACDARGVASREQQVPALRRELPSGVAVSTIALAATAGFLAFAGFESAGSLGEEAHRPGRFIPRAMLAAIALGAVFYVACMLAQSWGFGTDKAGVAAFAGSSAALGELALDYAGAPMAAVLDLVAVISAVGAGLGCVVVAIRMLTRWVGTGCCRRRWRRCPVSGSPTVALRWEMAPGLVTLIAFRLAGITPIRTFFLLAPGCRGGGIRTGSQRVATTGGHLTSGALPGDRLADIGSGPARIAHQAIGGLHEYPAAQRVTAPPQGETAHHAPVAAPRYRSC